MAAISSRLPSIQLSQVLRPASRFKPAAQHISNPSVHPSIHPSISPIIRSISPNQSINHHHASHYCLRRVTHVVSSRRLAAINESINQLSNFAKYFRKFPLLRAHFAKHFLYAYKVSNFAKYFRKFEISLASRPFRKAFFVRVQSEQLRQIL
eukprot:COSAG06_NODE_9765_length_1822_cov_12.497388_1_plen_152_part_00